MSKSTRYVATQDAVNAFADVAAKAPWLSIDTEFERIRTYYPKLCLVQIGAPGESVCIDPLADISLDPLREAIAESPAVKIFHAARQDLEVLHHALALMETLCPARPVLLVAVRVGKNTLTAPAAQDSIGHSEPIVLVRVVEKAHHDAVDNDPVHAHNGPPKEP